MIKEKQLRSIDIQSLSSHIVETEYVEYFLDSPGREHYKLLAYFSTQYSNSTLLDVGTYKGCSALALSYNKTNSIKSFDVATGLRTVQNAPENIEFIVDDVTNEEHIDLILNSPFILLDTDHDGPFEHKFYQHIKQIGYKGLLMLDDTKLNTAMIEFWDSITEEKYDITEFGHHSGTGIVIFK